MAKPKLTAVQSMILGIILGMLIVFGAFMIAKNKIVPKPIEVTQTGVSQRKTISPESEERCPVCLKPVSSASNFYENIYGKRYNFCNEICYRSFKDDPLQYIKNMDIDIEVQLVEPSAEKNYEEVPQENEEENIASESDANQENTESSQEETTYNTDDVPMPDEIPLDSSPSEIQAKEKPVSNSSGIEEIPLRSNKSKAVTPSNQSSPTNKGSIEEIPLSGQDRPKAPAAKPKKQQKAAPKNQSVEEIPLNQGGNKNTKQQELQIEEIPLN